MSLSLKPKMLTDDDRMPFGKHAGERLGDIPLGYLNFLWQQEDFDRKSSVGQYIQNNLEAFRADNPDRIWT